MKHVFLKVTTLLAVLVILVAALTVGVMRPASAQPAPMLHLPM